MQANLGAAAAFTWLEEGGYSDDPHDPGNWSGGERGVGVLIGSNFGVSAPELIAWSGPSVTAAAMRALSRDVALAIYGARYWQSLQGDALPAGVDLSLVDEGYNAGTATAGRMLQRLLGLTGADLDGWVGPQTLARLQAASTLVDHWAGGLRPESARSLQTALGVMADGVPGPQTLMALAGSPNRMALALCCALADAATLYYRSLPGFSVYGAGWLARVGRRLQVAINLVTSAPLAESAQKIL